MFYFKNALDKAVHIHFTKSHFLSTDILTILIFFKYSYILKYKIFLLHTKTWRISREKSLETELQAQLPHIIIFKYHHFNSKEWLTTSYLWFSGRHFLEKWIKWAYEQSEPMNKVSLSIPKEKTDNVCS